MAAAPPTRSVDISIGYDEFDEAKGLAAAGNLLDAASKFKVVIAMRPDAASPHYHLGRVLLELNRISEALAHFKVAKELQPDITLYQQLLTRSILCSDI